MGTQNMSTTYQDILNSRMHVWCTLRQINELEKLSECAMKEIVAREHHRLYKSITKRVSFELFCKI